MFTVAVGDKQRLLINGCTMGNTVIVGVTGELSQFQLDLLKKLLYLYTERMTWRKNNGAFKCLDNHKQTNIFY